MQAKNRKSSKGYPLSVCNFTRCIRKKEISKYSIMNYDLLGLKNLRAIVSYPVHFYEFIYLLK